MIRRPRSSFDQWAAERLGVHEDDLTIAAAFSLPRPKDLADGPESPLGGRIASHLDSYSESRMEELARLGEELLAEFKRSESSRVS